MLCIGILHLFRWKNLLSWFAMLMIGLIHLKKKKKKREREIKKEDWFNLFKKKKKETKNV